MVDDPYLFGRIAAHHSLNDIWAMAATPTAALAFVTLPLMAQTLMEEELFQLLSGVTHVLAQHNVPLVGGHSAEGAELGIGLTVVGEPGSAVLHKSGLQEGDHLVITKPLGTGVVLAAAMQGLAPGQSISAVQKSMDQSNAAALPILLQAKATALTDVTGFGLAGHLGEMLLASGKSVELHVAQVPVFEGVFSLYAQAQSSIQQANELALQDYELQGPLLLNNPSVRVLADPQTSGGLLAGIPAEKGADCLNQLRKLGFAAADIGVVTASGSWRVQ